jgi:NAD(P)-dependent dehydrogenase (short-subunit alcohol dehydrogenase family)
MDKPIQGKICLVTGATSGIGRATALGLAQMGATVVVHARSHEKGQATVADLKTQSDNEDIHLILANLESQAQIRALGDDFKARFPRLDVLVNNAALIPRQRTLTADGIETQFAINHLAYFLMTFVLLDALKAAPQGRVVNVSSDLHRGAKLDFDDLQSAKEYKAFGWAHYGSTKLMNVLFTNELARRLTGTNITANSLHPGVIRTQLTRNTPLSSIIKVFFGKPENGAKTSLYLASSPQVAGVTGRYFNKQRAVEPDPRAHDEELAKRLWEVSANMTGVTNF